jgi:hypothetical protein
MKECDNSKIHISSNFMSDNPTKEIIILVLSCRTARTQNEGSNEVLTAVCKVSKETCVLREISF